MYSPKDSNTVAAPPSLHESERVSKQQCQHDSGHGIFLALADIYIYGRFILTGRGGGIKKYQIRVQYLCYAKRCEHLCV